MSLFRLLALAWPKTCNKFIQDSNAGYEVCKRCNKSPRNHEVRAALRTFAKIGFK